MLCTFHCVQLCLAVSNKLLDIVYYVLILVLFQYDSIYIVQISALLNCIKNLYQIAQFSNSLNTLEWLKDTYQTHKTHLGATLRCERRYQVKEKQIFL